MPKHCGCCFTKLILVALNMERSVLSSQFVLGSTPEIKGKVAGNEGDVDFLLAKARFEEVKLRDLAVHQQRKQYFLQLACWKGECPINVQE